MARNELAPAVGMGVGSVGGGPVDHGGIVVAFDNRKHERIVPRRPIEGRTIK